MNFDILKQKNYLMVALQTFSVPEVVAKKQTKIGLKLPFPMTFTAIFLTP
jgi:hypothetical protein